MNRRIGFISTRFSGTDGVSLEAVKWARVFEQEGHCCYWFAGELDCPESRGFLAPEAHFKHAGIAHISDNVFGRTRRSPLITDVIHSFRILLKNKLRSFIRRFNIDLLVVQNAMTIPMNIPLGLALAEVIAETQLPTIVHHHDFFWERKRFVVNAVGDFMSMAFPADLPGIHHVVINSAAQRDLAHRRGIASVRIPNVLDFEHPPVVDPGEIKRFRQTIGLGDNDLMVLQPTRLIKRKGIEHVVELVKALKLPCCKLVISHEDGDEGLDYSQWLQSKARNNGVDLRVVKQHVVSPWQPSVDGNGGFSLWTVYAAADLVTFCSLYEGFGNGLLEAVYLKRPVILNRYEAFISDMEPLGFDFITMDGFLTPEVVAAARNAITHVDEAERTQEHNYAVAEKHFSFAVLRRSLRGILAGLTDPSGVDMPETPSRRVSRDFKPAAIRLAV